MKTSYELVAELMPAVRAMVAKQLSDAGMKQQEIAATLGISQPAVSQYLRNIRGSAKLSKSALAAEGAKRICDKAIAGVRGDELHKEMYALCEQLAK